MEGRGDQQGGARPGARREDGPVDRASGIQDDFFNRARREGSPVTIFLTNGKKLAGRIRSFDKFTIIVEMNRVEQMIFKHAISTVSLGRPWQGARERPEAAAAASPSPAPPEDDQDE